MTLEQIKMLKESYMTESTRPDGSKSTTGEYMRFITDCNLEFVTSKDMVLMDDDNQAVHCVCYNEDGQSSSAYPIKVITAPYEDIHAVETIMSQKNFEKFLENGYFNNISGFSADKKNFMIRWSKSITNKAQKPPHHIPFYNESKSPILVAVTTADEILSAVAEGKGFILSNDITLNNTLSISNDCNINLNGKTLTAPSGKTALSVTSGDVVIKNGIISAEEDGCDAIHLNTVKSGSACSVTIDESVTIIAGDCCVLMKGENAKLNTAGTLRSLGTYAAIQGNGAAGGISVNITGGTISSNDCGIYFPCRTTLNISGDANIIGTCAIYQKAGTMNISGNPVLIGNGECKEYVHNNNGCDPTGDAIIIEACNYPDGVPVVNINGGTFISINAKSIGYYQQNENYKLANTKFINDGVFSSDVSEYVKDGKCCVKDNNRYIIKLA